MSGQTIPTQKDYTTTMRGTMEAPARTAASWRSRTRGQRCEPLGQSDVIDAASPNTDSHIDHVLVPTDSLPCINGQVVPTKPTCPLVQLLARGRRSELLDPSDGIHAASPNTDSRIDHVLGPTNSLPCINGQVVPTKPTCPLMQLRDRRQRSELLDPSDGFDAALPNKREWQLGQRTSPTRRTCSSRRLPASTTHTLTPPCIQCQGAHPLPTWH